MTAATPALADPTPALDAWRRRVVLVTGPSGAGRSTAIRALEDLGFEVIDNLPLSLLPRLLEGGAEARPPERPVALGLDVRNRDWTEGALDRALDRLAAGPGPGLEVLFLDCADEVLLRRFSETRRRHPLAPGAAPTAGIARERELLAGLRDRADLLVDTTELTPHELRARLDGAFAPPGGRPFAVSVESFSFRGGLPGGLDMAFDCRFLRNPHWEPGLRALDGREEGAAAFVRADPLYGPFLDRLAGLLLLLLPAFRAEGKAHLAVGLGCTGGQHRSVTAACDLAKALADGGWQVSSRHRELERRAGAAGAAGVRTT